MSRARHHRGWVVGLLAIIVLLVLAICPFIGMQRIVPSDVLLGGGDAMLSTIFWRIRVPRICLAFLAGAGLSASGMAFQAMFRNPLATPFTLGVASGASLGAALYMRTGLTLVVLGISGVSVAAFLGALGAICLVYALARVRRGFSTATMLLAGIAVSMFFSSVILFLQYLSDFTQSFRILRWLMGGVQVIGFESVLHLLPLLAVGVTVLFAHVHELNLLATGEDIAASRGVDVDRTKKALFFGTSMAVGSIVAVCGPIGFVGMMGPHICRLLVGPNHRYLLPASLLFGGGFLTVCDTLARTVIAPAEIPVGVITALLGGPFFVWLLLNSGGKRA